jgi:hypothetical protein
MARKSQHIIKNSGAANSGGVMAAAIMKYQPESESVIWLASAK